MNDLSPLDRVVVAALFVLWPIHAVLRPRETVWLWRHGGEGMRR